jgi:hypothetical protein
VALDSEQAAFSTFADTLARALLQTWHGNDRAKSITIQRIFPRRLDDLGHLILRDLRPSEKSLGWGQPQSDHLGRFRRHLLRSVFFEQCNFHWQFFSSFLSQWHFTRELHVRYAPNTNLLRFVIGISRSMTMFYFPP